MAEAITFYVFGGLAVIAALIMITRPNPISAAWSLVVVMISLAALFVALSATFVAAMQVIVYAGAIMVLFLFVVMLLNLSPDQLDKLKNSSTLIFGGILAVGLLVVLVAMSLLAPHDSAAVADNFGQVAPVAKLLFSAYLLPFEVASVLLLAAIVGAVVLSMKEKEEEK